MNIYFGDIHNHCCISYGHGSLESALQNARLQLDFASVTGHAFWPDMPVKDSRLEEAVNYHTKGFEKLRSNWPDYTQQIEDANTDGEFITFPSYEVHSCGEGDYVVYSIDPIRQLPEISSMDSLRSMIKSDRLKGKNTFIVPHHIGYKQGYRGINWETFDSSISPFVEIISMHGCAESDDYAGLHYMHTMGPRTSGNTYTGGLEKGAFFGVSGSTDHHSAHPGSHGYGRVAVLADSLCREDIWQAFENRRMYAISGDKIYLETTMNGMYAGSIVQGQSTRDCSIRIKGGGALDHIDIVKNGRTAKRFNFLDRAREFSPQQTLTGKVFVEVGWGERGVPVEWDFNIDVAGGALLDIEPRFHGADVVDPLQHHTDNYQFTSWEKTGPAGLHADTITWGNPTPNTQATQGFSLEIEGKADTTVNVTVRRWAFSAKLADLIQGSRTEYLGGLLSGAVRLSRFAPQHEYIATIEWQDVGGDRDHDDYYIRAVQRNNQWAWSSPFRFLS